MREFKELKTKKGVSFGLMSFTGKSSKTEGAYQVGWMTSTGIFLEDEDALNKYIEEN